jgi:hypothetical protein
MNILARFAVAAVFYALVPPRAHAQWHEPLNCDDPGPDGGCRLYGISVVQLVANPESMMASVSGWWATSTLMPTPALYTCTRKTKNTTC